MSIAGFYHSTDPDEIASGQLLTPDGQMVRIVIRNYLMPPEAMYGREPEIKFVPLTDIDDDKFDVAIYMPSYLTQTIPRHVLTDGIEHLLYVAGITFHKAGPDAVSRLG
jgi:hypothetical protein